MILIADAWETYYCPPDRRLIKTFAYDKVVMPPVITKRSDRGTFSTADSRHFEAPLALLQHQRVRALYILKPVRGGGTLIGDVFVAYIVVNEPCPILYLLQDREIAKTHAEDRLWPILMAMPELRAMLSMNRHKTRTTEIIFANGLPLRVSGPALGKLQNKGYKVVVGDEVWLWEVGRLGQAKARMGDYAKVASEKLLLISQGGDEESDWAVETKEGQCYIWKPLCMACARPMEIEWTILQPDRTYTGARFDIIKHADGTYDKEATAKTVRYVCQHCGHEHPNTDHVRADWNRTGDYFHADTGERLDVNNPPERVLIRWHGLIDYPWDSLVREFLSAKEAAHIGNFTKLIDFYRKFCALHRSERSIHDSQLPFVRVASSTTDPKIKAFPEEHARCLTADRQDEDVYWVMIRAWAKSGRSRRLWFGRCYSDGEIEVKRLEYGVPGDCTLVDSGYKPKGDRGVYAFCVKYGWIALKGEDDAFFWHVKKTKNGVIRVRKPWAPQAYGDPGAGTTQEGRVRCALIRFSSPTCLDQVHELIKRGLWEEPEADPNDPMEQQYRIQMTAEFKKAKIDRFTGRKVMVYVCPSGNNHAGDCAKEQVLFAMTAGCLPYDVDMEEKAPVPPVPEPADAAT